MVYEFDKALVLINVFIKETSKGTVLFTKGNFEIKNLPLKTCTLFLAIGIQ